MPTNNRSHPGYGLGPPRYPGAFHVALREAAASLGWEVRHWVGHLVCCADGEGKERIVAVDNVYHRARRTDRAAWPALLAEFLRTGNGHPEQAK